MDLRVLQVTQTERNQERNSISETPFTGISHLKRRLDFESWTNSSRKKRRRLAEIDHEQRRSPTAAPTSNVRSSAAEAMIALQAPTSINQLMPMVQIFIYPAESAAKRRSINKEEEPPINPVIKAEPNTAAVATEYLTITPDLPPAVTTEEKPTTLTIGPNGTTVLRDAFENINWSVPTIATRSLLSLIFDRDTLATHTLSGKPSPAFRGRERPPKRQLDPLKVADIIHCVQSKIKYSDREIRTTITMKCADATKVTKRSLSKKIKNEL
ncbi:protein insensitive-like [Rhagoletis pomonella]|uniref:protein insensitive-like n=1 Tax=Rhagoletis pomonella TaxID=28610 RepID=UPI001783E5E9|nr:protein insensitive-like [Rhagoletis pomonella]